MSVRLQVGAAFKTSECDVVACRTEGANLLVNNPFNSAMNWRGRKMDKGNFHGAQKSKRCGDAPTDFSSEPEIALLFLCLQWRRQTLQSLPPRIRQGSSEVEQGTHKPLVGSSSLPLGTFPTFPREKQGLQGLRVYTKVWGGV